MARLTLAVVIFVFSISLFGVYSASQETLDRVSVAPAASGACDTRIIVNESVSEVTAFISDETRLHYPSSIDNSICRNYIPGKRGIWAHFRGRGLHRAISVNISATGDVRGVLLLCSGCETCICVNNVDINSGETVTVPSIEYRGNDELSVVLWSERASEVVIKFTRLVHSVRSSSKGHTDLTRGIQPTKNAIGGECAEPRVIQTGVDELFKNISITSIEFPCNSSELEVNENGEYIAWTDSYGELSWHPGMVVFHSLGEPFAENRLYLYYGEDGYCDSSNASFANNAPCLGSITTKGKSAATFDPFSLQPGGFSIPFGRESIKYIGQLWKSTPTGNWYRIDTIDENGTFCDVPFRTGAVLTNISQYVDGYDFHISIGSFSHPNVSSDSVLSDILGSHEYQYGKWLLLDVDRSWKNTGGYYLHAASSNTRLLLFPSISADSLTSCVSKDTLLEGMIDVGGDNRYFDLNCTSRTILAYIAGDSADFLAFQIAFLTSSGRAFDAPIELPTIDSKEHSFRFSPANVRGPDGSFVLDSEYSLYFSYFATPGFNYLDFALNFSNGPVQNFSSVFLSTYFGNGSLSRTTTIHWANLTTYLLSTETILRFQLHVDGLAPSALDIFSTPQDVSLLFRERDFLSIEKATTSCSTYYDWHFPLMVDGHLMNPLRSEEICWMKVKFFEIAPVTSLTLTALTPKYPLLVDIYGAFDDPIMSLDSADYPIILRKYAVDSSALKTKEVFDMDMKAVLNQRFDVLYIKIVFRKSINILKRSNTHGIYLDGIKLQNFDEEFPLSILQKLLVMFINVGVLCLILLFMAPPIVLLISHVVPIYLGIAYRLRGTRFFGSAFNRYVEFKTKIDTDPGSKFDNYMKSHPEIAPDELYEKKEIKSLVDKIFDFVYRKFRMTLMSTLHVDLFNIAADFRRKGGELTNAVKNLVENVAFVPIIHVALFVRVFWHKIQIILTKILLFNISSGGRRPLRSSEIMKRAVYLRLLSEILSCIPTIVLNLSGTSIFYLLLVGMQVVFWSIVLVSYVFARNLIGIPFKVQRDSPNRRLLIHSLHMLEIHKYKGLLLAAKLSCVCITMMFYGYSTFRDLINILFICFSYVNSMKVLFWDFRLESWSLTDRIMSVEQGHAFASISKPFFSYFYVFYLVVDYSKLGVVDYSKHRKPNLEDMRASGWILSINNIVLYSVITFLVSSLAVFTLFVFIYFWNLEKMFKNMFSLTVVYIITDFLEGFGFYIADFLK